MYFVPETTYFENKIIFVQRVGIFFEWTNFTWRFDTSFCSKLFRKHDADDNTIFAVKITPVHKGKKPLLLVVLPRYPFIGLPGHRSGLDGLSFRLKLTSSVHNS